jgi:hypothetical protein
MPTNTYIALDKKTIDVAVSNITFTGISSAYTDLVIIGAINGVSSATDVWMRVGNGSVDTGTNYSWTWMSGNSAGANSESAANSSYLYFDGWGTISTSPSIMELNYMNYANTSTYKSIIMQRGDSSKEVNAQIGLWRGLTAINTIQIGLAAGNFNVGTTFSLYGIAKEGTSPAPKATGGAIYSDSTYYYHVFGATGTFTPLSSLACDYLVVAGGAGGGTGNGGGGGGAGGYVYGSSTLSATGYTATIGAGGGGAGDGTNTTFNSLTALKGGKGGNSVGGGTGGSGTYGSGGGSGRDSGSATGGAGTSGQGFAGGGPAIGSNTNGGGGGGGAGGTGYPGKDDSPVDNGGLGGIGTSTYSSWSLATGIGQIVAGTYYIAGGGGGCPVTTVPALGGYGGGGQSATYQSGGTIYATSGQANTGSGGGGGGNTGNWTSGPGNGGSGVVIVRYAKV